MLSTNNSHQRQLFIIIVHYGSIAVTKQAIDTINANTVLPTQVIIIDQGPESAAELLTSSAASQKPLVILPSQNIGYGAAANMGLGYLFTKPMAADDIVVFINNDVALEPTTIADIYAWWQAHPEPALVGVTTIENNQELSGAGAINFLTGRAHLLPVQSHRHIDYVHGAFVMALYQVWLKSGGWPEQYFLYWEDVLLSQKIRHRGMSLRLADTIRIHHDSPKSTAQQDRQLYYLVRNGALFMSQETPWFYRYVWRGWNWVRLQWHRWHHPHSIIVKALTDAQANVIGPQPL